MLLNNNNIYYRLKQAGKNGNFAYINVITINIKGVSEKVVYPNPNRGVFNIATKNTNPKLEVVIIDALRKQVYHNVFTNTNAALVNLSRAKGLYLATIFDGKTTTHQKVAVQQYFLNKAPKKGLPRKDYPFF